MITYYTTRQQESSTDDQDPQGSQMDPPDPLAVTIAQAAALLGCSEGTVRNMSIDGTLPVRRYRSRIFVPVTSLMRFLAGVAPMTKAKANTALAEIDARISMAWAEGNYDEVGRSRIEREAIEEQSRATKPSRGGRRAGTARIGTSQLPLMP